MKAESRTVIGRIGIGEAEHTAIGADVGLQFQQVGKLSAAIVVLGTQTDYTAGTGLAVTTNKLTHSADLSNKLYLISWDQLDS